MPRHTRSPRCSRTAAWSARDVAAEPVRSLTVHGTAGAFAAAPSLRKFYVVREDRHAGGALEAHDARDGRFLRVVRACAHPVSLTANQQLARLYVLCTREVEDDVAASSLVTIDMRSDRTAGVVVLHDEASCTRRRRTARWCSRALTRSCWIRRRAASCARCATRERSSK